MLLFEASKCLWPDAPLRSPAAPYWPAPLRGAGIGMKATSAEPEICLASNAGSGGILDGIQIDCSVARGCADGRFGTNIANLPGAYGAYGPPRQHTDRRGMDSRRGTER